MSLPFDFEAHIGAVRNCKGVADVLGIEIDGRPAEINRLVVRRFMLAQRHRLFDDVTPVTKAQMAAKLPIGTRVRVSNNRVFGGFYGQVTKIKGRGVISAAIEIFGRLVPVELSAGDYTAIKDKAA